MLEPFIDSVHNEDLIPIDSRNGVVIYSINYESLEKRDEEFRRKLIELGKKQ